MEEIVKKIHDIYTFKYKNVFEILSQNNDFENIIRLTVIGRQLNIIDLILCEKFLFYVAENSNNFKKVSNDLGILYYKSFGMYTKALKYIDSENPENAFIIGSIYLRLKKYNLAKKYFEISFEKGVKNEHYITGNNALYVLIDLYLEIEDYEKAGYYFRIFMEYVNDYIQYIKNIYGKNSTTSCGLTNKYIYILRINCNKCGISNDEYLKLCSNYTSKFHTIGYYKIIDKDIILLLDELKKIKQSEIECNDKINKYNILNKLILQNYKKYERNNNYKIIVDEDINILCKEIITKVKVDVDVDVDINNNQIILNDHQKTIDKHNKTIDKHKKIINEQKKEIKELTQKIIFQNDTISELENKLGEINNKFSELFNLLSFKGII